MSSNKWTRTAIVFNYLSLVFILTCSRVVAGSSPIHIDATTGQLSGPTVSSQGTGYSGSGYITNFLNPNDTVTYTLNDIKGGLYDVKIRYRAPSAKGYDLVINGSTTSGMFEPSPDKFILNDAGLVNLNQGINTIEIKYGWGHYDINSIDLIPASLPKLLKPSPLPVNPNATPEAKALKAYLVNEYGTATLSGQHTPSESEYVSNVTGKSPAIVGNDLIEYSPSRIKFGSNPGQTVENMIAQYRAGHIITMMWHWNAPTDLINKMDTDSFGKPVNHLWYFGFYTYGSTFDLEKAIDNPGSPDYQLLLSDMDAIAAQLQKFSDANVPVLWRPLHEAEGGWFWWGAKGPEAYKKLWRLMYDRFTNYHHLNNLIWVYSSGTNPNWYPGDKYVDIVGVDEYPSDLTDSENQAWNILNKEYGGRKLIALTEFGGVPDIPKMFQLGERWSYFYSWSGDVGPRKNSQESLKKLYNDPTVLNADQLPKSFH